MKNITYSGGLRRTSKSGAGGARSAVRRWLWVTLVCVIIAPLAAAVMAGTASAAPATAVAKVSITETDFSPAVAVVAVGTTVQWKNNGTGPHSLKGQVTSPAVLQPGGTYERKFTTPGEYQYFDGNHPDSMGAVLVIAGGYSPPREHGQPVTHLYRANLTLVVNESWTYYDGLGCQCTDPPCNSQTGSGERSVHLSVLFSKVTYERDPAVNAEALYDDNVRGHFGDTTESINSLIATDSTPLVTACGNKVSQKDDCHRNFTGKRVTLNLAWGPTSTKNTFLVTNSGPEITPGSCQDEIDGALVLVGVKSSVLLPLNLVGEQGVAYDSARTDGATSAEVGAMRAGRAFTVARRVVLNFTTSCCEGFNGGSGGTWANTGTVRRYTASLTIRFTPIK